MAGFCAAVNRELAVEGREARLCYVCPAPADTEAERPFAGVWRELGATMVAPDRVANFVLDALLAKKTVAVMGFGTRLLACTQAMVPPLVDWLVVRRMGPRLKRAFGDR